MPVLFQEDFCSAFQKTVDRVQLSMEEEGEMAEWRRNEHS